MVVVEEVSRRIAEEEREQKKEKEESGTRRGRSAPYPGSLGPSLSFRLADVLVWPVTE